MLVWKNFFQQVKKNKIAKNTVWMLIGYVAKIGLQAITFVLLARELGIEGFGMFSSTLAVASIIAPFVHLGAYNMVIENIMRGIPVSKAVGNNLAISLLALPVGVLIVGIVSFYLKTSIFVSINISIAIFLGGVLISINKAVNISKETLKYNSYLEMLLGLLQIISALILARLGGTVLDWSIYYLICNLFAGTIAIVIIIKRYGWIDFNLLRLKNSFRSGLHFAFAGLANNGLFDIDKTMLTKFASLEATGIFSVAQRVVSMVFLPVMAFLGAVYPRFVNLDNNGYFKSRRLAFRIIPIISAYSLVAVLTVWGFAPLLVGIIGEEFTDAVIAIRILGVLIIIQGLQYPFADALTGSGHQKIRTYGQISILILNIVMNLALIPNFGWVGAAWGSLISQLVFLIFLCLAPIILIRKKS